MAQRDGHGLPPISQRSYDQGLIWLITCRARRRYCFLVSRCPRDAAERSRDWRSAGRAASAIVASVAARDSRRDLASAALRAFRISDLLSRRAGCAGSAGAVGAVPASPPTAASVRLGRMRTLLSSPVCNLCCRCRSHRLREWRTTWTRKWEVVEPWKGSEQGGGGAVKSGQELHPSSSVVRAAFELPFWRSEVSDFCLRCRLLAFLGWPMQTMRNQRYH